MIGSSDGFPNFYSTNNIFFVMFFLDVDLSIVINLYKNANIVKLYFNKKRHFAVKTRFLDSFFPPLLVGLPHNF